MNQHSASRTGCRGAIIQRLVLARAQSAVTKRSVSVKDSHLVSINISIVEEFISLTVFIYFQFQKNILTCLFFNQYLSK